VSARLILHPHDRLQLAHTYLFCSSTFLDCRTISAANSRARSLTEGGSFTAGGRLSGAGGGDDDVEREAPLLHLPQLNTGLSEAEIKDLAYLVFASNCGNSTDGESQIAHNPASATVANGAELASTVQTAGQGPAQLGTPYLQNSLTHTLAHSCNNESCSNPLSPCLLQRS
jgi:hypothetical protein